MSADHRGIVSLKITASGTITTASKAGLLYGYVLKGGTTASSIVLNNGGSGGTVLWEDFIKAQTAAGDDGIKMFFDPPIVFSTDIYATLAGTGATACIAYKEIGK